MKKTLRLIIGVLFLLMMLTFTASSTTTTKPSYAGQTSKPVHITEFNAWSTRIDYNGTSNPVFIGEAQAGENESDNDWRIQKIGWSGSNPVNITWAQSSNEFEFRWSNRTNYTYR